MKTRMTDVFVIREASMHAWKMLDLSPSTKEAMEKRLGNIAYDMALALRTGFPEVNEETIDQWLRSGFFENYPEFKRITKAIRGSPRFVSSLRKGAPAALKMGMEQRRQWFQDLLEAHSPDRPPEFDARSDKDLELEGGWRWTEVPDGECSEYEGRKMQHCGTRMADDSKMFSLRDPEGEPHVTVEVNHSLFDDGLIVLDPGIIQLKGKQNGPPVKKYWPMVKSFVESLSPKLRKVQEWQEEWDELRAFLGQPD